jgi:hypothetical protein
MTRIVRSQSIGLALGFLLFIHGTAVRAELTETEASRVVNSGVVTLGLSYGAALIVAATSNHRGDNRLYVPLLGPWLDLNDRGDCAVSLQSCDHETTNKVLLVGDGLIQAIGAVTILAGLMAPSRRVASSGFSLVQVVPVTFGQGRPGLAAYGVF